MMTLIVVVCFQLGGHLSGARIARRSRLWLSVRRTLPGQPQSRVTRCEDELALLADSLIK